MGAHPWFYFVKYQQDAAKALQELREREFHAGRYSPVIAFPPFPVDTAVSPGAKHKSIELALSASGDEGTRSVLDVDRVSDTPQLCAVVPLDPDLVMDLYGTHKPTREMVEENMEFFEQIDRGQGIYITIYEDGQPSELFFAGYSFD